MSEPASNNLLHLAHLAAVLRPAFRCPTTPEPLHELYCRIVDALDGETGQAGEPGWNLDAAAPLDAGETALRAVIMLRNATASGRRAVSAGACVDLDDSDPDIGLHLALFGVQTILERLGWSGGDRR
ncbi:MAG: hypothetical protein IT196_06795 [Acidimicrobiales bacterium]|nr:hypothetical protein [Acidimicrobiales bacterium]